MVKPGYRQTEIGVIPENWEVNSIQSVVTSYRTGGNYKNSPEVTESPLIKMGNLSRGYINLHKIEYVTRGVVPNPVDRLQYGDVLFNTRNTPELVGKTAVWRNELPCAYYNLNLLRFEFDSERVEPFFFNAILNTKEAMAELKNIAKGTTSVAAIYPQDLMNVKIPIPPISEQRRIAKAITDMDCLIEFLEKQIHKKKAIKQGAMQELLTGKRRLPGFKGEWRFETMHNYIGLQVGFPFSSQYFNDKSTGLRLVKNRDLKSDDQIYYTTEKCSTEYIVKNGDILVGMDGDFLPCKWEKGPALLNQRVGRLIRKGLINLHFAYYALQKPLLELQIGTGATTVKHLSHGDIANLTVWMPPSLDEQQSIAEILSCIDNEIVELQGILAKYRQIKQGMMQQLLTGKIRLL